MTENVFVYGTLMYPQVLQTLLNRVPRNEKAVINGYRRFAINGQVFPGTIPSTPDCSVRPTEEAQQSSNFHAFIAYAMKHSYASN